MPTTRHRYLVPETDEVHAALEVARAAWPNENSPAKLLTRLAVEGADRLRESPVTRRGVRDRALAELHAVHPWPQEPGYLEAMRERDWPE